MTHATCLEVGSRHTVQKSLQTAVEIQIGKEYGGGFLGRNPVKEL